MILNEVHAYVSVIGGVATLVALIGVLIWIAVTGRND